MESSALLCSVVAKVLFVGVLVGPLAAHITIVVLHKLSNLHSVGARLILLAFRATAINTECLTLPTYLVVSLGWR
jgi:hypothetical protein